MLLSSGCSQLIPILQYIGLRGGTDVNYKSLVETHLRESFLNIINTYQYNMNSPYHVSSSNWLERLPLFIHRLGGNQWQDKHLSHMPN